MPFITNVLQVQQEARLARAVERLQSQLESIQLDKEKLIKWFKDFSGRLVWRGDQGYEQDRMGHSLSPDLASPLVICHCRSANDVAICLKFAREYQGVLNFAVRSGGHSNAGFSLADGMVIDISCMNGVFVADDRESVVVLAGTNLGTLNNELNHYGLHVPGGECPTVGIAGHTMGGGYGFTSRNFGLSCDAVKRIWMMLADGTQVIADKSTNADLFWAVRGGTGNTFGVLLKVEYRTVKLGKVWGFALQFPIAIAAKVLVELQRNFIRKGLTHELGYQCALSRIAGSEENAFYMMGIYNGCKEMGMKLLKPLCEMGGQLVINKSDAYPKLNNCLLDWWELPKGSDLNGLKEVKRSNYIDRSLSEEEWTEITEFFCSRPNKFNLVAFETYGGRASAPHLENAFIHRQVDFEIFIDSFSNESWKDCPPSVAEKWAEDYDQLMAKFSNGHRYQNYPHRHNPNYRWEYWGDAYPSLLFVKKKYDPTSLFDFPQGITPYPKDPGIRKSTAPSVFCDPNYVKDA